MKPWNQITIDVRTQSFSLFSLAGLWWISFFKDAFFSYPNLLWVGICYLFPFVMPVFAGILLFTSRREQQTQTHKWLVWLAIAAAFSPWVFLLLAWAFSV